MARSKYTSQCNELLGDIWAAAEQFPLLGKGTRLLHLCVFSGLEIIEDYRGHFARNVPEIKIAGGMGFFFQVEAYEIFHGTEETVWQWKEELFRKSRKLLAPGLRRAACVGTVLAGEAACRASPLVAPGNRPKSQAEFARG